MKEAREGIVLLKNERHILPLEPGLQGQYFNSNDLSGSPAVSQIDHEVNCDGFNRGEIPAEISLANQGWFSARWTGRHLLEEIELRVFRYLREKCDLKLPHSPKCAM